MYWKNKGLAEAFLGVAATGPGMIVNTLWSLITKLPTILLRDVGDMRLKKKNGSMLGS